MAKKKASIDTVHRLAGVIHKLYDSDPENLLRESAMLARKVVGADEVSLLLVDPSGKLLIEHVVAGRTLSPTRFRMRVGAEGITGWVAGHKKTAIVPDVKKDSRYVQANSRVRSEAAVPILEGNTLLGVLNFESRKLNFFLPSDVPLLEYLASQIAVGFHIGKVTQDVDRLRSRLELLHHLSRLGNGFLPPDAFLDRLTDALRRAYNIHYTGLFLGDHEKGVVVILSQSCAKVVDIKPGSSQKIGTGLIGMSFKLGETFHVKDVTKDPIYIAKVPGVRSELCIPIRIGDRCLGILDLQSLETGTFTPDDVVVCETIGHSLVGTLQAISNQFAAKQHPLSR